MRALCKINQKAEGNVLGWTWYLPSTLRLLTSTLTPPYTHTSRPTVACRLRVSKMRRWGVAARAAVVGYLSIVGVQGSSTRWIQDGDKDPKRYRTARYDHLQIFVELTEDTAFTACGQSLTAVRCWLLVMNAACTCVQRPWRM